LEPSSVEAAAEAALQPAVPFAIFGVRKIAPPVTLNCGLPESFDIVGNVPRFEPERSQLDELVNPLERVPPRRWKCTTGLFTGLLKVIVIVWVATGDTLKLISGELGIDVVAVRGATA
jgi:hypothetical protein